MNGYSRKEYIQFKEYEESDDEWEQTQTKVKYTLLQEEEFDEDD
jgi:hypothetical protein